MFLRRIMIIAVLVTISLGIAGVNAQVSTEESTGSKMFIIWVGDKNSLNLPGAEVYLDGNNHVGTTNSRGEVRTPISFGTHTIRATTACGSASKEYAFSDEIDAASLYINTCPDGTKTNDGSVGGTVLPGNAKIGFGSTPTADTNWVDYIFDGQLVGIYVDVDTSSAGFTRTPIYITSLGGDAHHWGVTGASSIYEATPTSFRIYLKRPDVTLNSQYAKDYHWYIQWIGIESA